MTSPTYSIEIQFANTTEWHRIRSNLAYSEYNRLWMVFSEMFPTHKLRGLITTIHKEPT